MSYCKWPAFLFSTVLACRVTDLQNHCFHYRSEHVLLHLDWLEGYPDLRETERSSYEKKKEEVQLVPVQNSVAAQ